MSASQRTRLVRSRSGEKIHLATCRYAVAGHVHPWLWAEGRDDEEWIVKGWLHPCRTCLSELARRQDELRASQRLIGESA